MRSRLLLALIFALTLLVFTHSAWAEEVGSADSYHPILLFADQQTECVLVADPPSVVVGQGMSVAFSTRVPSCGLTGPVVLAVTGLPAGATYSFNPPVLQPPANGVGNSTLTVSVALTTPVGSYPLNVTASYASSPPFARWVRVIVNVLIGLDEVSIHVSPQMLSIGRGEYGTATLTATSIGAFSSNLLLTVSGLPADVTATFQPPNVTPPAGGTAQSTIRISVGNDAMSGTYPLTVVAENGTFIRSAPLTLVVPGESLTPPTSSVGVAFAFIGIGVGVAAAGAGLAIVMSGRQGSEVMDFGGYYYCRKHRVPLWYVEGKLWCPLHQRHVRTA